MWVSYDGRPGDDLLRDGIGERRRVRAKANKERQMPSCRGISTNEINDGVLAAPIFGAPLNQIGHPLLNRFTTIPPVMRRFR